MVFSGDPLPLVGRDDELQTVRQALMDPAGRGILIAGPAGVGKTRLALEAAGQLTDAGWRVLAARTSGSGAGLPLAALAGLPTVDEPPQAPLSGPVPRALAQLRRLAAPQRTLLLVDDAHLLDEVSATVIHQAVAERTLPLLATLRTDAFVPDAVTRLWKDTGVRRLELEALRPSDIDTLIVAALGGPVEGRTLYETRTAAGGNPLFLRELLASAREAGRFTQCAGVWRLTEPLSVAPRLIELLGDRLATTDPDERDGLELLAIGQPLPLAVATDLIRDEVLERLERRGLVDVITSGRRRSVQLSHPLYGELLRAGTPELARLRHSRRLAGALEGRGARRADDIMRIALWRLDGGGELDPGLMLTAATQAALVHDFSVAQRLARRARESGGGVRAGLMEVHALFRSGRRDTALRLCRQLATEASAAEERVQIALQHLSILLHGADDLAAARTQLAEVADLPCPVAQEAATAYALMLRAYQLDCSVLEAALTAFRTARDPGARLVAVGAAATALMLSGRYTECVALMAEALPIAAHHHGPAQLQSDMFPIATAEMRGYLEGPRAGVTFARSAYEATLHPADPVAQSMAAFALARQHLLLGQPETALRFARESALAAGQMRLRALSRWAAGLRLQAAVQAGVPAELPGALAELARSASGPRRVWLLGLGVARGLAWHAAAEGDLTAAGETLAAELIRHGENGAVGSVTLGAMDLVRLGQAEQAVALLTRFPPPAGWPLGDAAGRFARAARAGDAAALLAVAQEFDGYGMPLHTAEAAALAVAVGEPDAPETACARRLADTALAQCERLWSPVLQSITASGNGDPGSGVPARRPSAER